MLSIEVNDLQSHLKGGKARVAKAVGYLLRQETVTDCRLSVTLVDEARIRELNLQYLGRDEPTDVISFDLSDGGHDEGPSGEIVISAERAVAEATRRGNDPVGELLLYALHGVLHLVGYDDRQPREAAKMHARENEILTALGCPDVFAGPPKPPKPLGPGGRR